MPHGAGCFSGVLFLSSIWAPVVGGWRERELGFLVATTSSKSKSSGSVSVSASVFGLWSWSGSSPTNTSPLTQRPESACLAAPAYMSCMQLVSTTVHGDRRSTRRSGVGRGEVIQQPAEWESGGGGQGGGGWEKASGASDARVRPRSCMKRNGQAVCFRYPVKDPCVLRREGGYSGTRDGRRRSKPRRRRRRRVVLPV